MSTEENKATIQRFYDAFDRGGPAAAEAFMAPDLKAYWGAAPATDLRGALQMLNMFHSAFPDGKHSFDGLIAEGDKVVTYGTWSGTQQGEFQGVPATGKRIAIAVMHVDTVAGGKIVEHRGMGDFLGLLQQLGAIPTPG